ncbi:3,4-dihydroxy-2-butanone 4-phosphate synthase [Prauserella sp. Am3]|nr:3,4-dihydroxy-2-butanone 4-phosphate synthase [Prauserella sp. Am3]
MTAVCSALTALQEGSPVLVVRESGGDVVVPAVLAQPRWTSWAVRHSSGFLGAPLTGERADLLALPPMVPQSPSGASAVAVDAARGVTTGISAADRARTARVLADPGSRPGDLNRPGHVIPLRAQDGGVLARNGSIEASVDLCRLAGLPPVALAATLVTDDGEAASPEQIAVLGETHGHPVVGVADVVAHRLFHGDGIRGRVTRGEQATVQSAHGPLTAVGFRDEVTGSEHVALVGPQTGTRAAVAVHVECLLGDVFGAAACTCARRLDGALCTVAADGGVLIYLRTPATAPLAAAHRWTDVERGAASAIVKELGLHDAADLADATEPRVWEPTCQSQS